MKQRDDENAAQAIGTGQSNLPSTGAVKEVDNELFFAAGWFRSFPPTDVQLRQL